MIYSTTQNPETLKEMFAKMDRYLMLTIAVLAALHLNTASGMLYYCVNCMFHSFQCVVVLIFADGITV